MNDIEDRFLDDDDYEKYEQVHPRSQEISALLERKVNLSHRTFNEVVNSEDKKQGKDRNQGRDDRATTEQVMDPRTRMILFKLLNRGIFEEIHGCVSTGKEANVYHATTLTGDELAIKVYKTSILVFRDRDKYVSGDHRFRSGYGRGNPRKMVRLWAEKELKNLNRLRTANIPAPNPIMLRGNVLVMEFLGHDGWPAPRLKDANLDSDKLRTCYLQCLRILRLMFQVCKLVHGDLSEYNMLYWKKQVQIIDVSQSVELDHPRALDFLRTDCINVTRFFGSKISNPLSARRLFNFVISETLGNNEVQMDAALEEAMTDQMKPFDSKLSEEMRADLISKEELMDKVFMDSFIPRSLNQVDFEEIMKKKTQGEITAAIDAVTKMTVDVNEGNPDELPTDIGDDEPEEDEDEDENDNNEDKDDDETPEKVLYKRKDSSKEERKAHKLLVKAEKAEKRKTKVKKKDKKLHRVARQGQN